MASANNAASTAANGLFLLSQAHHELTKREEQARASSTLANPNNSTNGKRSTKRKSYDMSPPPSQLSRTHPKRSRVPTNGRGRKPSPGDMSDENDDGNHDAEDDDVGDHDDDDAHTANGTKRAINKKPETEEEKRKNFLERNRQGILLLSFAIPSLSYLFSRSCSQMSATEKGMAC